MQLNTFKLSARAKKSAIAAIKGYMVGEPPLMAKWSYDAANTNSAFYDELKATADELTDMGLTPEILDGWIEEQEQQTAYEVILTYLKGEQPLDQPRESDHEPFYKYRGIEKIASVARRHPSFVTEFNLDKVPAFLAVVSNHCFTLDA